MAIRPESEVQLFFSRHQPYALIPNFALLFG